MMKKWIRFLVAFIIIKAACSNATAQMKHADSIFYISTSPKKIGEEALKKIDFVERAMKKASDKMLAKFERQQEKLRKKLARIDSSKASLLFDNAGSHFEKINSITGNTVQKGQAMLQQFPSVDELSVSLGFLQQSQGIMQGAISSKLKAFGKLNELKAKLANLHTETERAEAIKQFINERKQLLREQLSGLNLDRQLEKIHRSAEQYNHLVNDLSIHYATLR